MDYKEDSPLRSSVESLESLESVDESLEGDQEHNGHDSDSLVPEGDEDRSAGEYSFGDDDPTSNTSSPRMGSPFSYGQGTRSKEEPKLSTLSSSSTPNSTPIISSTPSHTPTPTPIITPSPSPVASDRDNRKPKRAVSVKIKALQNECGFFRRPPPSLSASSEIDPDSSETNGGHSTQSNHSGQSGQVFRHTPIASPTRDRPRGPSRRPPTPTRR